MPASDFYDVGPLSQIAINLFYGWGYNFYRVENQLRADDQLVRTKACSLLGDARASVVAAESAYRRTHIPPPTRSKPFPDSTAIADAQALERLSQTIGALEGQIRSQPTPESDRISDLYHRERDVLNQLGECDHKLIGQAELLRGKLAGTASDTMLTEIATYEEGTRAIEETLRARRAVLLSPR